MNYLLCLGWIADDNVQIYLNKNLFFLPLNYKFLERLTDAIFLND